MSSELTPDTRVNMTVVRWLSVVIALAGAVWVVGTGYSDIKWTLRTQGERLASIDGKLQQYSPTAVKDEARRVCREVTSQMVFGCSCVRAQGTRLSCQCKAREERNDE